jgi:hypothetical protein
MSRTAAIIIIIIIIITRYSEQLATTNVLVPVIQLTISSECKSATVETLSSMEFFLRKKNFITILRPRF